MTTMMTTPSSSKFLEEIVLCPYCKQRITVQAPSNYEPIYLFCKLCGKRFITERIKHGMDVCRLEDAPCCSDPDCRVIETGQGQEE